MPTPDPAETALRIAPLISTALNVGALFANDPEAHTTDRRELRSVLLWTADKMAWMGTVVGTVAGISWPADAPDRIERLRLLAGAWDPAAPPPSDLLEAARTCVAVLQPTTVTDTAGGAP